MKNNLSKKDLKIQFRKKVKEQWAQLSEEIQNNYQNKAIQAISSNKQFIEAETVLIYACEYGKEICFTKQLMELFPQKRFGFPRINDLAMNFYYVNNYNDLVNGKFNILSPPLQSLKINVELVDLLFIPAQAADQYGNRLGRGGGFYDRFLAQNLFLDMKFCVLPEFACFPELPAEKFDVKIDHLISIG